MPKSNWRTLFFLLPTSAFFFFRYSNYFFRATCTSSSPSWFGKFLRSFHLNKHYATSQSLPCCFKRRLVVEANMLKGETRDLYMNKKYSKPNSWKFPCNLSSCDTLSLIKCHSSDTMVTGLFMTNKVIFMRHFWHIEYLLRPFVCEVPIFRSL